MAITAFFLLNCTECRKPMTTHNIEVEALMQTVEVFYPSGDIYPYELYKATPEYQRLSAIIDKPPMKAEAAQLHCALQEVAELVYDMTLHYGPAYHFWVHATVNGRRGRYIVFVSQISSYFYIFRDDDLWQERIEEYEDLHRAISGEVAKYFPGFMAMPPAIAKIPVPERQIGNHDEGEGVLLEYIFTNHL